MAFPAPGGATQVLVPATPQTGVFADMITDINAQLAAHTTYVPTGISWSAGMNRHGVEFHSYQVEYFVGGAAAGGRIVTGLRDEDAGNIATFINNQLNAHTNVTTYVINQSVVLEEGHHVLFALVYQEY